jgi:hypothetical protein
LNNLTLPTIPTAHSNQLLNLIIIEWTSYPGLSVRDGTSQGTFTCLKWSLVPPDLKSVVCDIHENCSNLNKNLNSEVLVKFKNIESP